MKPIERIKEENPGCRVISTHLFITMVKSNPRRYNSNTGDGIFHNGEHAVPISVWREDIEMSDPFYEIYPYVLWFGIT